MTIQNCLYILKHALDMFRANREFAQTQDCPAQTRNSNFAAQSLDCADRRSEDPRRMQPAASDATTPSH